jgi:hypothetical protein
MVRPAVGAKGAVAADVPRSDKTAPGLGVPAGTDAAPGTPAVATHLNALDACSLLIAVVMVAASSAGLFGDVYRDNTWSTAAFRGTDAATLFLAAPTLVVALVLARRGSLRGRLVWLGVLAYNVYNYAFYVFGTAFNDWFLAYAAALGSSLILLVFATPRVLPAVTADNTAPYRLVGGYLAVVGAMFGLAWAVQAVQSIVEGEPPAVIAKTGIHTSIVFGLDLTLVVPWLVIAGVALWRRTRSGVLLGVVMNVLAVLYMAALAVSGGFMADAGIEGASWADPPYLEIGLLSLVALGWFLPAVRPARRP